LLFGDNLRWLRNQKIYSPMMAYLAMMAPRSVELHRVLKPTGHRIDGFPHGVFALRRLIGSWISFG
jgi:hypothetical protein